MSDLSLAGGLWHVVHTDICLFALLVLGFGSATGCGETYAGRTGGTGGTAGDVGDGAIQEIPQPATWDFLDSQQSIRNSDDLLEQRAEMIETVFKGPMPTRLPDAIEATHDEYYPGLAVERLTIETDDFASIVYLIQPPLWTGGLALYHQGHAGDFRTNGEDTIQGLLDAGHQVLAFAMPMRGMNTHPYENNSHNQLVDRDRPLAPFAEPVVIALNWADTTYSYSRRFMIGISGGGWTTVLIAGIDERIDASYPVAGSWPHYLRELYGRPGDLEQRSIPSYLELYLMATYPNRQQVQGFNVYDSCCFRGLVAYDYLPYVSFHAQELGGHFNILMDYSHKEHWISPEMLAAILSLEGLAMDPTGP
jgi:hypothetical protein